MKKLLLAISLVCFGAGPFVARAQEVTDPNHTVVRFEVFTGGTNFGRLDLELFDQEKPETVRNFLRYVYNNVYSNMVLYRLVTNFVLQAGHVSVTNPASQEVFNSYQRAVNYGPIVNEYSVGPTFSNVFGTIAMARISGQTNSASADWFLNLQDNPFLDTFEGGYTVFGRVVNTVDDHTGTNLLALFNLLSTTNVSSSDPIESFSNLPVSFSDGSAPRYADLFTVKATIIQGPGVQAPNHTIVRMNVVTEGTNFGKIDIELFDQEKPETVKNFLTYVYSGVYSNLVLHRLVPGSVLQAGRVQISNPSSASQFSTYTPGQNFGNIPNEYGVGPQLSNLYGTIAMARVPGQTNSASGEFYFNLTNNPSFDTQDGGFTVFGRVINSFDEHSGTNLLNYFNSLPRDTGVRVGITGNPFEVFSELPMAAFRTELITNNSMVLTSTVPPQYRDLFVAQAMIIQGSTFIDHVAPSVSLDDLTFVRTTNSTLHFSGSASDNMEVARVIYDTPLGRFVADGKSNWTADAMLTPGTNTISVRTVDYFGNISPAVERTVFYSLLKRVSLQMIGKGKVTGVTDGQILEVGAEYQATATPARGYYFNGWRGDGSSNDRTVTFVMKEDLNIVVRFSKTLLGLSTGKYEGFFIPTADGPPNRAGMLSVNLRANGLYSGSLKPVGASYGVRGLLDGTGRSLISGPLGTNVLLLDVELAAEGYEALVGYYSDQRFFSQFVLWHQQKFSRTNLPATAGTYTFTISPPLNADHGVTDGSGFGTMTVDAKGRIKIAGALADNIAIKEKTALLSRDNWPFYFSAKKSDSIFGMATFTSNTFSADLKWFGPNFPGGTNLNAKLIGSLYRPQAPLFDWVNGTITLSGGGLSAPISSDVVLNDDGSFTVASNTNNIQLSVAGATGLVTGSFTHPVSNVITPLQGAVLQSSNSAAGFFPDSPRNGGFVLRRAP